MSCFFVESPAFSEDISCFYNNPSGNPIWGPCREGQINALDRVQKKAAQFTNHAKNSDWETLVQRRTIARL